MRHTNLGDCKKCDQIFDRYEGFYEPLRDWFKAFQTQQRTAHISCAGRGRIDQEVYFERGASRAHFGESAHNYNAAIDIFGLINNKADFSRQWYEVNLLGRYPKELFIWYGEKGSEFPELPHLEVKNWKLLRDQKIIKLVEGI